ncbi:GNAT family N-acetyltransferase [Streptomyces sp. NBC_00102]|uniref:GNAT family N-acetyltransferase n=1 Tax=Streptomyces sp. NBC_00102 TaxID=2975652 RepID=UPI0022576729|nr:GNAT family N-acetyltransferase [Streptomyces sp. NBC_00102]MCX5401406.1 GNAT family N-acetyltransferase [Streptomyces sp. NBC_00102]
MDARSTDPGAVLIRRAVAKDAKQLTRLVRTSRAYEGHWAPMVEGYRVGPDYIEAHRVFVAVAGTGNGAGTGADAGTGAGTPVLGFYSLVLDTNGPDGPDGPNGPNGTGEPRGSAATGELDLMFVADAAQERGIGRLLIAHLRKEAARAGLDAVRVVSHPPAEGFYRRVGAERTGTVPATPPYVMWDRPELTLPIA